MRWVQVPGGGLDVDEHRFRPDERDRARGGEEAIGGGDDLVARADAERAEGEDEGVGARRPAATAWRVPARRAISLLERLDPRAEDEHAGIDHLARRLDELLAERAVLRREIHGRDLHSRRGVRRLLRHRLVSPPF